MVRIFSWGKRVDKGHKFEKNWTFTWKRDGAEEESQPDEDDTTKPHAE